jgi:hypothetical protein
MPAITAASLTDAVLSKQCTACGKELQVALFYKDKSKVDGLRGNCKRCSEESSKKSERKHAVTRQTNRMLSSARFRSKLKKISFDIDLEHVRSLVVSHCPILGVQLEWSARRGNGPGAMANSPSLDRIDPSKGYVKGNVWIISNKANAIKNDATHEELKLVTRAVGEALVRSLEF